MASDELMKEFDRNTFYESGPTETVFQEYEQKVKEGKVKAWTEYPTFAEKEKHRKELIIEVCKKDRIPYKMKKLMELWSSANLQVIKNQKILDEATFYIKELEKLAGKKKFTYKDTYKVDDLFKLPYKADKKTTIKFQANEDLVLTYLETALLKEVDVRFLQRLQAILDKFNFLLEIGAIKIEEK